jgi:hypothetical protein
VPRGFYIFDGYAAQRAAENSPGTSSPQSQHLDVAAQTVVRAIDSAVIDLFNRAEVSGNGGQNNTGGGITHTSVTTGSPIESWRQLHFATTANSGIAADTADPDVDSLTNLIEFAFGLNPNLPTADLLSAWQKNGATYSLAFTVPAGVSGVSHIVEYSRSLATTQWTTLPNTGTATHHAYSLNAPNLPNLFFRFRVTRP